MFLVHHTGKEVANATDTVIVIALCLIIFWRTALRALLASVILAAIVGAVVLLHGIH